MDIIDWNSVSWGPVILYGVMAFLSAFIANFLSAILGDNRIFAALLTGLLFAAAFVGWNYYPHGYDFGLERGSFVQSSGTNN